MDKQSLTQVLVSLFPNNLPGHLVVHSLAEFTVSSNAYVLTG